MLFFSFLELYHTSETIPVPFGNKGPLKIDFLFLRFSKHVLFTVIFRTSDSYHNFSLLVLVNFILFVMTLCVLLCYARVCPLNNAYLFYYSAYMQFCQVLFLKKYICVNLVLDKIEIWVYNVHRNPQGGLYTYPRPIFRSTPRVFLGILSEYLAQKYSPELVNKDFGDFLVTVYVCTHRGGWYWHRVLFLFVYK